MSEQRTKIRAFVLGAMIVGMAALSVAPAAQAVGVGAEETQAAGSCISIYPNGPGVAVDPANCERFVKELVPDTAALP
jgi:hypothetical protein